MSSYNALAHGTVKVLACATCTAYVYRSVLGRMKEVGYDSAASVVVVFLLRWWGGGSGSVKRELDLVCSDWIAAPTFCTKAYTSSWMNIYTSLLVSLAVLPRYFVYGPLVLLFYQPYILYAKGIYYTVKYALLLEGAGSYLLLLAFWFVSFFALTHVALTLAHRYFAHKCFSTSRLFNFLLACFCCISMQPMWWASIHRRHHHHCDKEGDPHSPALKGFWYAYLGWLMDRDNYRLQLAYIRDWVTLYPELLLVDFFQSRIREYLMVLLLYPVWPVSKWWLASDVPRDMVVNACMVGLFFAIEMSKVFNAYAHSRERQDTLETAATASCLAKDVYFLRFFGFISGGESYHLRHHENPQLALNSPYWYEDWIFWVIWAFEKCGFVWNVQKRTKTRAHGEEADIGDHVD